MTLQILDTSLHSSLEWVPPETPPQVWELNFGWEISPLSIFDEAHFRSYQLAISQFLPLVHSPAKVVFAKGGTPFSERIAPCERLEEGYQEYLDENRAKHTPLLYEVYCANLFSEYLHRLAAPLPEELIPTLIHLPQIDKNPEAALIFSKRRFAHFELEQPPKGSIGVSLPQDALFDPSVYQPVFDALHGTPFQCIPEEQLNDFWDGLDDLLIDPKAMSETALRMLFGFEAAGGTVVSLKGSIPEIETSTYQDWIRSRGI